MIFIPIVFAVLFALALFGPVSNFGALPAVYEAYGIGDSVPWPLLVLAVALPPVLYVVGLLLGRGRPPFARPPTAPADATSTIIEGFVCRNGKSTAPITTR